MIAGLPAHPLIVHLAVVLLPVAALVAAYGAIRPLFFAQHKWLIAGLTAVAGLVGAITNSTGEALMVLKGASEADPGIYGDHAMKAKLVVISAGVLLVLVLVQLVHERFKPLPKPLMLIVRILTVFEAVFLIASVVFTGHAGALLVWQH